MITLLRQIFVQTGFPNGSVVKNHARRRWGFSPWIGKIPWRRKWQPIPVFLPEKKKPHGQRSLAARVGHNWPTKHSCTCSNEQIIRIENKGVLWFIKTLLIGFIPHLLCTFVGGKYKCLYLFSSWKLWTYQNWEQWLFYKGYCSRKLVD